jgi:hypothetical protein
MPERLKLARQKVDPLSFHHFVLLFIKRGAEDKARNLKSLSISGLEYPAP